MGWHTWTPRSNWGLGCVSDALAASGAALARIPAHADVTFGLIRRVPLAATNMAQHQVVVVGGITIPRQDFAAHRSSGKLQSHARRRPREPAGTHRPVADQTRRRAEP
jgi:hypothetical protein